MFAQSSPESLCLLVKTENAGHSPGLTSLFSDVLGLCDLMEGWKQRSAGKAERACLRQPLHAPRTLPPPSTSGVTLREPSSLSEVGPII